MTQRETAVAVEEDGLAAAVEAAFAVDGPLALASLATDASPSPVAGHDYRRRDAQVRMAAAVAHTIEARDTLVVEAGTGVGKTYAYLVPVLLSGRRALVSTATKSLQEQLFLRDLPRVTQALGTPVHAALLKGRDSYLCLHRMKLARTSDRGGHLPPSSLRSLPPRGAVSGFGRPGATDASMRSLARIERWSAATSTGDLAEVEGLDEGAPVLPLVTSTRDNCLGSSCPDFQACHVVRARREAMAADIVVVNHHLFFADMQLRGTGMAELLPTVDVVVLDEAHHLIDTGVTFLGLQLSTAQVVDLARDILAAGMTHARGLDDWAGASQAVERAARDLRLALGDGGDKGGEGKGIRMRWADGAGGDGLSAALAALCSSCEGAAAMLATCSEIHPAFASLEQRAREQAQRAQTFVEPVEPQRVRWIDTSTHHARLIDTPLDIAQPMRALRQRADRAWIFTSATLGEDAALSWFSRPAGLDDANTLQLGSPYDHAANARLWICADAPRPEDGAHASFVAAVAADCAQRLGGRTMVLTTTLRALARIAQALRSRLRDDGADLDVIVQGEAPKRVLLQRLRDAPHTVLIASQSFWEGVDVPGDALQCVVIDKLPFPPPNDPLVEARAARVEREGGNAFNACFLADAAVSLKQGAGRLIRSETDRGLLVICDPRLARMSYGRRLVRAMTPMTPITSAEAAMAWLDEIAVRVSP